MIYAWFGARKVTEYTWTRPTKSYDYSKVWSSLHLQNSPETHVFSHDLPVGQCGFSHDLSARRQGPTRWCWKKPLNTLCYVFIWSVKGSRGRRLTILEREQEGNNSRPKTASDKERQLEETQNKLGPARGDRRGVRGASGRWCQTVLAALWLEMICQLGEGNALPRFPTFQE